MLFFLSYKRRGISELALRNVSLVSGWWLPVGPPRDFHCWPHPMRQEVTLANWSPWIAFSQRPLAGTASSVRRSALAAKACASYERLV
jgi:hypothetical protein